MVTLCIKRGWPDHGRFTWKPSAIKQVDRDSYSRPKNIHNSSTGALEHNALSLF
jgi:hypothetical protein